MAVLIAQADTAGAVKALNGYLAEFAADGEAWLQLAKLHIGALNYEVCKRRHPACRRGWLMVEGFSVVLVVVVSLPLCPTQYFLAIPHRKNSTIVVKSVMGVAFECERASE